MEADSVPNIYAPDKTFNKYLSAEGDVTAAKERMQEVLEENAPEADDE